MNMLEIELPSVIAVPASFDLTTFFKLLREAQEIDVVYNAKIAGLTNNDDFLGESQRFAVGTVTPKVWALKGELHSSRKEAQEAKNALVASLIAMRDEIARAVPQPAPVSPAADL